MTGSIPKDATGDGRGGAWSAWSLQGEGAGGTLPGGSRVGGSPHSHPCARGPAWGHRVLGGQPGDGPLPGRREETGRSSQLHMVAGTGHGVSLLSWDSPSPGWDFFWGGKGGDKPPALWLLGWERGPLRQWSLFSPQFRENLQDVLPSLPSQDDYFLLKWLRGIPRVGDTRGGGAGRAHGGACGAGGAGGGAELSALLQHAASTCPSRRRCSAR